MGTFVVDNPMMAQTEQRPPMGEFRMVPLHWPGVRLMRCSLLAWCAAALLPLAQVQATAPPAQWSREQLGRWAQRNRWLENAGADFEAGRLDGAILALSKGLDV